MLSCPMYMSRSTSAENSKGKGMMITQLQSLLTGSSLGEASQRRMCLQLQQLQNASLLINLGCGGAQQCAGALQLQ